MTLGQVLFRDHRLIPVNIIPPLLSILIYHMGDEHSARLLHQISAIVSPHRYEQQQQHESCGYVYFLLFFSFFFLLVANLNACGFQWFI
jgi:hypothetical protein